MLVTDYAQRLLLSQLTMLYYGIQTSESVPDIGSDNYAAAAGIPESEDFELWDPVDLNCGNPDSCCKQIKENKFWLESIAPFTVPRRLSGDPLLLGSSLRLRSISFKDLHPASPASRVYERYTLEDFNTWNLAEYICDDTRPVSKWVEPDGFHNSANPDINLYIPEDEVQTNGVWWFQCDPGEIMREYELPIWPFKTVEEYEPRLYHNCSRPLDLKRQNTQRTVHSLSYGCVSSKGLKHDSSMVDVRARTFDGRSIQASDVRIGALRDLQRSLNHHASASALKTGAWIGLKPKADNTYRACLYNVNTFDIELSMYISSSNELDEDLEVNRRFTEMLQREQLQAASQH